MTLALSRLRGNTARHPIIGVIHGLTGAVGFGLLIVALRGPRRGDTMGFGSFGMVAAVLFGIALTLGPSVLLLLKRAPRFVGVTIAVHAAIAITAFVLLLAWAQAAP